MTDSRITTDEAIQRAWRMVNNKGGMYRLGTGDYRPKTIKDLSGQVLDERDLPWTPTPDGDKMASDCSGFAISWCWKLRRHRPGFNKGPWATVSDDINVNSIMEDATHHQELATKVKPEAVRPGDLLCYPTIYLRGHKFIGHVGMVVDVPLNWRPNEYSTLMVIHCHGPNGLIPPVTTNLGKAWEVHDRVWPKVEHRTHVIRMKERP